MAAADAASGDAPPGDGADVEGVQGGVGGVGGVGTPGAGAVSDGALAGRAPAGAGLTRRAVDTTRGAALGFGAGLALPFAALRFLLTHRGVKRWAILPLVVNALLYALILAGLLYWVSTLGFGEAEWAFWGPVGGWLSTGVNWLGPALKWMIALPLVLAVAYFSFTTVGMVLASPINDLLSESVERHLCDPATAEVGGWRLTVAAALNSLIDSLGIVLRQVLWSVPCLVFLLVPVVGWIPLFLVTAYFTGLGFLDVAMARNWLRNRHKRAATKRCFWAVFGLGVAMEMLFLIPFAGLLMLPLGVVGGTLLYCRLDWPTLLAADGVAPPPAFRPPVPKTFEGKPRR